MSTAILSKPSVWERPRSTSTPYLVGALTRWNWQSSDQHRMIVPSTAHCCKEVRGDPSTPHTHKSGAYEVGTSRW
jgi:hypothetical protein